jgi:hypothetical protein
VNAYTLDRTNALKYPVLYIKMLLDFTEGSRNNKFAILSAQALVWQGAKAQEYQVYSELSQHSHAGCMGA